MQAAKTSRTSRRHYYQGVMDGCFDPAVYRDEMRPLVVVIDDDNSVRESLESLIRSNGLAVRVFASAEEFLGSPYVQQAACLVLDVRMPRMSGRELHCYLLSEGYEVPVIFITAYVADEETEARALADGALAYLIKPFDEGDLLRAIHKALKSCSKHED